VTAAGAPEPTCPSAAQVAAVLAVKVPASVPGLDQAASSDHLRLELTQLPAPAPAPLQIELWDDADRLQLRRTLPGSSSGDPAACLAMAETIALIVDRYVHAVEHSSAEGGASPAGAPPPGPDEPPPPVPDPPTEAAVLVMAGVDLQRMAHERGGGVTLTVGVSPQVEGRRAAGHGTLRRIPLRLGTYVSLQAGPGRLEPGLNLGADILLINIQPAAGAARSTRNLSPNVEAAIAYRLRGGAYFARGALAAGLAVPSRQPVDDGASDPVLSTPRTYIRLGLETGIYFR
jgi:hypothetical protein